MCNDPVSKIYLSKRLLPLDDRVITLSDTVQEKHHKCAMDDLYNSANFFKAEQNHEIKY